MNIQYPEYPIDEGIVLTDSPKHGVAAESNQWMLIEHLSVSISRLRDELKAVKMLLEEQQIFIHTLKRDIPERMLTPREAAKVAGVSYETMIAWANWKEIDAIDVSKRKGSRPRWRIDPAALRKFLIGRTRFRNEPTQRRRRVSSSIVKRYV